VLWLCKVQWNFAHPEKSGSKSLALKSVEIKDFENLALGILGQLFAAFLELGNSGLLADSVDLAGRLLLFERNLDSNSKYLNEVGVRLDDTVGFDTPQRRLGCLYSQPS
jgi:hypothetical protein